MSPTAHALIKGARKTNGITEYGANVLRSLAAALIAGNYNGKGIIVESKF